MTISPEEIGQLAVAMRERGVYGVRLREHSDGISVEISDPVLGVEALADRLGMAASTVRGMEKRGLLHAIRTKGRSGALRFRLSRVYADLQRAEEIRV